MPGINCARPWRSSAHNWRWPRASTLQDAQAAAAKGDAALGHAERILTQLLLLARVNAAGSQPLTLHPLDLTELAGRLTADLVPAAAAARIDLGFEATGAAYITAEPLLIGELLGNLISNAIAYAGPGAEVTVRVLQGEVTVLEVEDTGPGIPPARRATVRQRFARGATQSATGMGLGLPIIEEIATLFHGTLALDTGSTGHGLRARVTFPGTGGR